jgi:hypothetical protein
MVETPAGYVPTRGEAVWISLHPQAGHEQAGRRPAVVLSPAAYNGRVGLAIFCPITNQRKGYPFGVACEGCGAGRSGQELGLACPPSRIYLCATGGDGCGSVSKARNAIGRPCLTKA